MQPHPVHALTVLLLSTYSAAFTRPLLNTLRPNAVDPAFLATCARASRGSEEFRTPFIGGNWKCFGTRDSVKSLVSDLNQAKSSFNQKVEVIVAPPWLHVPYVLSQLDDRFEVATQNVGVNSGPGAFTGEVSADMIRDFGVDWTIVGHSERREGFGAAGESSAVVARKAKEAVARGLKVIACIGEKKEQRESRQTEEVLREQLSPLAEALTPTEWSNVVLAYEPVWAIGTGLTATPQQAQDTHQMIRQWVGERVGEDVAKNVRIIYGGSVKPSNARELFTMRDVDGFLVGGASLKGSDFASILAASDARVSVAA